MRTTLVAAALLCARVAAAQDSAAAGGEGKKGEGKLGAVWRDSTPIALTLVTELKRLQRDEGDAPPWRPATIQAEGMASPLDARVRARGNWRRKNCYYPPLRLDAPKGLKGTPLAGLDRPKIVVPCRGGDEQERWILQEYMLYRVYQQLSPIAHRARLLRLTIRDRGDAGAPPPPRWAILVEEGPALAKRVGAKELEQKGTAPGDLEPFADAVLGIFQFMIGNTDWSLSALHNTEVLAREDGYYPVPYDFDWSGAVEASYAIPAPELGIRSVRERRYRGYCVPPEVFARAIAHVQSRRPAIEALYGDELGRLLPEGARRRTLAYFADFWAVLDNPAQAKRQIVEACRR